MAAVQMNVRIDEDVKARGDEVFARAGFTPSQVVRAVWEYAEQTGEVPAFMRASGADADEAERRRRIALAEYGAHILSLIHICSTCTCGNADCTSRSA